MMNQLDNYLINVLSKQLKEYEMTDSVCERITSNIKVQMLSLLQYWQDEEFRNTILTIGLEEATFYKPNAKIEIKCFVVVTIRNSLLETLASDGYKKLYAKRMITDDEIQKITSAAIEYFAKIDFKSLKETLDFNGIDNIYKTLKETYPVAWRALSVIGNTSKKTCRYDKGEKTSNNDLINLISCDDCEQVRKFNKVIMSGYDETLDEELVKILKSAYSKPGYVFYSNCFKMISRNVRKLFRVIDFLLCSDATIITINYYITNGYIEIRRPFIRPAHTSNGNYAELKNFKGLSSKHLNALKQMLK